MLPLVLGLVLATLVAAPGFAVHAQSDPIHSGLSTIRLDKAQIYSVRDITLNRDVFSISLNRGAIAFTEAIDGRVTGGVFLGSGDILAIPPDPIEKQQLFRYTKSALLSEHFEAAVFRFTDGTYEEILKQHRSHAQESVDAADAEQVLRWEPEIQRRGAFLNDRILADLLASKTRPLFLAQIEGTQLGWFDAIYDDRRVEEILVEQNTTLSTVPLVWMSFHKRAEVRDPPAVAHEDKSLFDIVSVNENGTTIRLKATADGERVIELPGSGTLASATLENGTALPFVQGRDHSTLILPAPSRAGAEIGVHLEYTSPNGVSMRPRDSRGVTPASYRDQWVIEGLAHYTTVIANRSILEQARDLLLGESPEGKPYDVLGPVWIGFRMEQPRATPAYQALLRSKSIWIMHMLRHVIQRDEKDASFARFLDDILKEYGGKSISTYDVKRLAEKHAAKPLDWFFDAWVFGTGIPNYKLEYKLDSAGDGFVVSGNMTQTGVPDTFEVPVPLYADDTLLGMVTVSSAGGEFRFTTRAKPQQILIDPKGTILTAK